MTDHTPLVDVPRGTPTDAAFAARKHTVRTGRSRKGRTTQTVVRYGTANLIGSWCQDSTGALTPEALPIVAEMVARRGAFGWHSIDVLAVTQAAYGDLIPPLMGTDVRAFAQMTPARTGVRPDRDENGEPNYYAGWASADACNVARHRSDLLSELPMAATSALPEGVTDGQHAPGSLKAWPTRYALPKYAPRRNGDPVGRHEVLASSYCLTGRDHLATSADRTAKRRTVDLTDRPMVWNGRKYVHQTRTVVRSAPAESVHIGRDTVRRPIPANGVTTQGKRTRVKRAARTVEHIDAASMSALMEAFGALTPGQRVTWTIGPMSGAFTRSNGGRYNVTFGGRSESRKTLLAVERILTNAA